MNFFMSKNLQTVFKTFFNSICKNNFLRGCLHYRTTYLNRLYEKFDNILHFAKKRFIRPKIEFT